MAGYEITRADPDRDRDTILALWARNLKAHDPNEHQVRYDWLCRCPFSKPYFWLARKDGEAVGTAGIGIRQVCVDGLSVLAGIAGDFAVDAKHRMLQPALSLQKAVLSTLEDGIDVVYGLPNANAEKVFQRQGYQTVGTLKRYVKILRTSRFLRSATGLKRKAAVLAPVVDAWLRFRSPETWRGPGGGRVVEPVTAFDSRFDDLWARASRGAPMIGTRTSEFLRWRYADCPLQKYVTVALAERTGGRLLGYIAWYAGEDEQVRVADWVTDGSQGAAGDLLGELIRWSRRHRMASVACELLGSPASEAVLKHFGFVQRECKQSLMASSSSRCAEAVREKAGHWLFLRGDENINTL